MRPGIQVLGIAVFLGLGNAPQSFATDDYTDLLAKASESINRFSSDEWAFTETSVTSGSTFIGRYDARRPAGERWTLDRVDDRMPTDKEREEFVSKKRKGEESNDSGDDDTIESMVKLASLKMIEETESHWIFDFEPQGDGDDEAFMKHVIGELQIAKENLHVSSIRLRSTEPFKPEFGIKVNEFLTVMHFGPIGDTGQIAPHSVDFKIKARAFLVKNVEEQSTITYSDYEYVGGPNGA